MSEIIKVSAKGVEFTVLRDILESKSQTLRNLISDLQDLSKDVVPLPDDIDEKTFRYIVEWLTFHKEDKEPEKPVAAPAAEEEPVAKEHKIPEICDWDKDFFGNMTQEDQFKIIAATNFLDIRQMLEIVCGIIATACLGKTPKQVYEMFGVEKELTPEEEEAVRKENPWLEDN